MSFRTDNWITGFDRALRIIAGVAMAERTSPGLSIEDVPMSEPDRRHSAGLMRVNHVGEVCAQALYQAQGQFARSTELTVQFAHAAREEEDHLAWTAERITQLGSHPSVLNPIWFAGAYVLGMVAARAGDAHSLGFVVETERQVEAHLSHHLDTLPVTDTRSRAIVLQMRDDEVSHGAAAQALGASSMPKPARLLMGLVSKVMTRTAYYL
ncbi:2-polyprenyl-3-methyl-6-methoxy-1,4-benzoquinone monooxygenase [Actimicrobium sp. CCI2.3]|uniref:2-polyprenyl-3-methyl-6-methoxy-1,4-benzoquinone monooxygenase n=1 Tax=Actimicrobium sp. CCI2.3 TaxID=3048616 RepID=UPI002AB33D0E|nr:2-polyprenyl-3-methyl-6-methoxy-1,4-benzoquinone monooxygenase [Actimicrobium sp. CCI2.3]MDY7573462.1 2-polyprenyl-3-methyl-6-methoxy-1,4-benzoquinone monooxygenase [Actimicrobium sp. CCI2.3]MEB0022643.1 2-polyprenyl-3-methyl-6-methoxy-1,4-benzoquinone monooxygenase [Actimicrobium sp. CCI2.3]